MRPRQWVKNLLVFVAPAAAGVLTNRLDLLRSLAAFGIFCAVASGVYLMNDAVDAEADRLHPEKRTRPVASGALTSTYALAAAALLMALGLVSAWFVARWALVLVIGIYALISIAYAFRLKREPVIELAAVASGFVLRAIAGGVATHIPLSSWFLAVASFGALFVVTGKRAGEHRRHVHRVVPSIDSDAHCDRYGNRILPLGIRQGRLAVPRESPFCLDPAFRDSHHPGNSPHAEAGGRRTRRRTRRSGLS
jgi:4-hydroxybenzoate polyprenyltransferase